MPLSGESLFDLVPPDYQGLFTQLADASDDSSVAMPLEVWRGDFMQDATLGIPQSHVASPDDVAAALVRATGA